VSDLFLLLSFQTVGIWLYLLKIELLRSGNPEIFWICWYTVSVSHKLKMFAFHTVLISSWEYKLSFRDLSFSCFVFLAFFTLDIFNQYITAKPRWHFPWRLYWQNQNYMKYCIFKAVICVQSKRGTFCSGWVKCFHLNPITCKALCNKHTRALIKLRGWEATVTFSWTNKKDVIKTIAADMEQKT